MAEQLMTVQEFADAAGISRQAVYKHLSTDLSTYLDNSRGQKMIKQEGLSLFADVNDVNHVDKTLSTQHQELLHEIDSLHTEKSSLQAQIELLKEQIADQKGEIADRKEELSKLYQLYSQEQQLHGKQLLLLEEKPKHISDPEKKKIKQKLLFLQEQVKANSDLADSRKRIVLILSAALLAETAVFLVFLLPLFF